MDAKEYVLRLPLQQIALRKTAILLWTRFFSDSLDHLSSKQQSLEFLFEEVKERVPGLYLPFSVEHKLVDLLLPIGKEVQIWKEYHRSLLSPKVAKNEIGRLCWTTQGTVDYRKNAERLISLESVNDINSFKISCVNCFDKDIQKFWGRLKASTKKYFYNDVSPTDFYDDEYSCYTRVKLVYLWTCLLKGDTAFINRECEDEPWFTFNHYAFESAALSGNKAATEYFFQKLTLEEREKTLIETVIRVIERRCLDNYKLSLDFPEEKFSDVGIYLLSQMSQSEKTEVFKMRSYETLICFLDWPWQDLFVNIAKQMWTYLSIEKFRGLLTMLSYDNNNPELKYESMFMEFFLQSPNHFINGLFADRAFESVYEDRKFIFPLFYEKLSDLRMEWFCYLFKRNKSDCIKLVLRNINCLDRERLILSKLGVGLSKDLVSKDKWFLFELFIEECALSNEAKEKLKSSLMECYFKKLGCETRMSKLRKAKFLKLLHNSDSISNKRRIEELET